MTDSMLSRLERLTPKQRRRVAANTMRGMDPADLPDEIWLAYDELSLISEEDRRSLPPGVVDAYPMTMPQLGMIAHMLENGGDAADGVPTAYHNVATMYYDLPGFDPAAFAESARRLVDRHEIFRTAFSLYEYSRPMQLVYGDVPVETTVYDLRALGAAEQENTIRAFAKAHDERVVDLSTPPLIRFSVHRLSDTKIALTLVEPHAISDGWSTHLSLVDLLSQHNAVRDNGVAAEPLPTPRTKYRHSVAQQLAELNSTADRQYWRSVLRDAPKPTARPAMPAGRGSSTHRREIVVPAPLVPQLREGARRLGVHLRSVLLAVHLRVLSRRDRTDRAMTGLTVNTRLAVPDGTDVRGMFLNIVPFVQATGGSWHDLVRRVDDGERSLAPHRRWPLAAIARDVGPGCLPNTMFVFNHFHSMAGVAHREGIDTMETFTDSSRTNYQLETSFNLSAEVGDRLTVLLVYDASAFDDATVDGYFDAYLRQLEEAAAELNLDEPVAAPGTGGGAAPAAAVHLRDFDEGLAAAVRSRGDAVAVRDAAGSVTFERFAALVTGVARALVRAGLPPSARIGVMCRPSVWSLVATMAILRAGHVYVPLDTTYPAVRRQFMIDDAALSLVLTDAEAMPDVAGRTATVRSLAELGEGDAATPLPRLGDLPPSRPAYIIYTSGSTGRPKGVIVPYDGLVNRLGWMQSRYLLGAGDVVLHKTSIGFDVSVWEVLWPVLVGAATLIADRDLSQDTRQLADLIRDNAVTVCHFVPSLLRRFLDEPDAGRCSSVREVISSGEVLTPETVERFYHVLPSARLSNLYGPTECTIDVTSWDCSAGQAGATVPIGRPLPGCRIDVLDERLQPVPDGATGEICVAGVQVALGYVGQAGPASAAFLPDPFDGSGSRMYRTGDLGRWRPDGVLEYLGRNDRQVKLHGVRLEPAEIEQTLRRHPGIADAAVEVERPPGGEPLLAAYVSARRGHELAPAEVVAWARTVLPRSMAPGRVTVLAQLPILPNGKLDRAGLTGAIDERPVPPATAPIDEVERSIADVWAQVLGLTHVDVEADLFTVGLDSISTMVIIGKLRSRGIRLSLDQVMQCRTIRQIRSAVGDGAQGDPGRRRRPGDRRRSDAATR